MARSAPAPILALASMGAALAKQRPRKQQVVSTRAVHIVASLVALLALPTSSANAQALAVQFVAEHVRGSTSIPTARP